MKLMWNEALGLAECPYVYRWGIAIDRLFSLRLHHWLAPDDDRYCHDHPWWFLTFVLRGGYNDISPDGSFDVLHAPAIRFRSALHRHTVSPHPGGAWTVILTGPKKRVWGFWVPKANGKLRLLTSRRYFWRYGHHPCE